MTDTSDATLPRRSLRDRITRVWAGRWSGSAFAGILGLGMATGQAPVSWPWLALPALAVALLLISADPDPRRATWRGWWLGTGYFAGALFWIVEPFLIDAARHGFMAPFALAFLSGGLALLWSLAFALAARAGSPARRAAWAVLLLTLIEMSREWLMTGFPWALLGYIWTDSPQLQLASLLGPHALTFVTLIAAALPAMLGLRRGVVAGLLVALVPGLWGMVRLAQPVLPAADAPIVRLIQPNVAQSLKWDSELMSVFFERQLDMTAAAPLPGQPVPDLVVWPETAVAYRMTPGEGAMAAVTRAAGGTPVALGLLRWWGDDALNSLAVIDGQGQFDTIYDKHHLVPFGEYLPFQSLADRLGITAMTGISGFARGPGPQLIDMGDRLGTALPLICYEAIFPHDLRDAPGRADWILQVTNDAWFGRISGPWQHLAQARVRAVEQGLPFLRASNTGVSAVIDAHGNVLSRLELNQQGLLDAPLPPALPPTVFVRWGNWPLLALCAIWLLGCVVAGRRGARRYANDR